MEIATNRAEIIAAILRTPIKSIFRLSTAYLRIFPTSGVTLDNFVDILRAGAVGVGFVQALFRPSWLTERDYDAIQRHAARIMELGNAL